MRDARDPTWRSLPSTHWSLVREAGHALGPARRRALGELLSHYLSPLATHLRYRFRLGPERAGDLVHEFILRKVLEGDLIAAAEGAKGRFRTFLLTALDRFAIDQLRADASRRRAIGDPAPLDAAADAPATTPDPADLFDVLWAKQVLAEAVEQMRQECHLNARPDLWAVFEGRVLAEALGREPVAYAQLAGDWHWQSPAQGYNLLVTANRLFARVLRGVVGRYERGDWDIGREIETLYGILSRPGARSVG